MFVCFETDFNQEQIPWQTFAIYISTRAKLMLKKIMINNSINVMSKSANTIHFCKLIWLTFTLNFTQIKDPCMHFKQSWEGLANQSESKVLKFGLISTHWYDKGSWFLKLTILWWIGKNYLKQGNLLRSIDNCSGAAQSVVVQVR